MIKVLVVSGRETEKTNEYVLCSSDHKWGTRIATSCLCVSGKKTISSSQIQRRSSQHTGVYSTNSISSSLLFYQFLASLISTVVLQLRVSGFISNAPYFLVVDCDMYCNDPTSAKQAMCFFLDPQTSKDTSFVQFPQMFHNLSKKDIYDSQTRTAFKVIITHTNKQKNH